MNLLGFNVRIQKSIFQRTKYERALTLCPDFGIFQSPILNLRATLSKCSDRNFPCSWCSEGTVQGESGGVVVSYHLSERWGLVCVHESTSHSIWQRSERLNNSRQLIITTHRILLLFKRNTTLNLPFEREQITHANAYLHESLSHSTVPPIKMCSMAILLKVLLQL